jgi:hypothetical protein
VYDVLARREIGQVCPRGTVSNCATRMGWMISWEVWAWFATIVPWAFIAAAVAFVGEEVGGAIKRRRA